MALNTFSVRIAKPKDDLGSLMSQIRSWLDSNKIEPADFKTIPVPESIVAVDIRFESEDQAALFQRTFA